MLDAMLAEFQANIWLYLSMPVVSGLVGYGTNVLAIKMMFYPLDFVGWQPFLGWQGIVPRKARKMARIAVDTMVPQLVSEREVFDRLDPQRVAEEIEKPVIDLVEHMIEEIMTEFEPGIWETLPLRVRDLIVRRVQGDAPELVAEIMGELRSDIDNVFDLKSMVIDTLERDRELINRIFLETGRKEFVFIGRSGFYFGFLFGLFQMAGWVFYKGDWLLPVFGLMVGYATNWLALRMIFQPQQPRRFGPWVVQGLFHKRQREVARDYAQLIADEIVTPGNIIEAVLRGTQADRVFNMIAKHVKRAIDEQSGIARPFVAWTVGTRRYAEMKDVAVSRIVEHLPRTIRAVDDYAKDAMGLHAILAERLQALAPDEYEDMLRPAFREDEWMLIAVGAALGLAVGVGQLIAFKAIAVVPVLVG